MAELRIELLGGFRVVGDREVRLSAKKARALLAYLALERGAQARSSLATLLWGDSGEAQARKSLRQALSVVRKALPDGILIADTDSVDLDRERVSVDALELERALAAGTDAELERAARLYAGELLEGLDPRAEAFDEWLLPARQRFREVAMEAISRLLERQVRTGADARATETALRLVSLDPLRESAHRELMRLYARRGRRTAALRQYETCRELLRRELGMAPEADTERLHDEIRTGRFRSEAAAEEPEPAEDGMELRQVTVVFAGLGDLGGDAEEAHARAARHLSAAREILEAHGGTVIRELGETLVAAFGLPRARTTDAERAVRAALALKEAPSGEPGRVQIGVASGQVLVSPVPKTGTLTGEPLNVASRLQGRADEGEALLADATYQSLAPRLEAEPLDDRESGGQPVWRLGGLRDAGAIGRRFVGRELELAQFRSTAELCARRGRGHTLLIRGEAGLGKTALAAELRAVAVQLGFQPHEAAVLDFGAGRGQDAVRSLARSLLGLEPGSDDAERRRVVEELREAGVFQAAQAPLLYDLLDLSQPPELRSLYDGMDAAARDRRRVDVLRRLVERASRSAPLLLVIEDLHWAETETLSTVGALVEIVEQRPALLVATLRPEKEPGEAGWRAALRRHALTTMDLPPLRRDEAEELAAQLVDPASPRARACIDRAGGNALFLEQLLRSTGDGGVPGSIHSIVLARMDELAPADRRALQAASVLGQRFTLEALRWLLEEEAYECDALVDHMLVRPQADGYLFGHALVRDAAYASLLGSRRAALHSRAAAWFRDLDPALAAEHLELAGDESAPAAYLRAAELEAGEHRAERALHLAERGARLADGRRRFDIERLRGELLRELGRIDESIEAFRRAIDLDGADAGGWLGLATALRVLDRYDDALAALETAEELARQSDRADELAVIHYQRGNIQFPLGERERCLAEHEKARDYARQSASPLAEARAEGGLGDAHYMAGRMITAGRHFARCLELCDAHRFSGLEVIHFPMWGITRLFQNELDGAEGDLRRAIEAAQRIGNWRAEVVARVGLLFALCWRGESAQIAEQCDRSIALAREVGARRFEPLGLCHLAETRAAEGRAEEADELLEQAERVVRASDPSFAGPYVLGVVATTTRSPETRRRALAEGEEILASGCVAHNHLMFLPRAIEACLQEGDWDEASRYAGALERYTEPEPLPWSRFFSRRGRVLARIGRGEREAELACAVADLAGEAEAVGLTAALPALEEAGARL